MRTAWGMLACLGLTAFVGCDDDPAPPDAGQDADRSDGDGPDGDGDEPLAPCPTEMALIDDGEGRAFCIDRWEHPGREGVTPTVGLAWPEAREACVEQAKELCLEAQWRRACVGTPVEACLGEIGPTGQRPDCVSEAGVFDLGGNVAEWTASPGESISFYARGGSGAEGEVGCEVREDLDAERGRSTLGLRCCKRPREVGP